MAQETALAVHEPTTLQIIQDVLAQGGKAAEMALVVKELVALKQSEERFAWEREERQARIDFDNALNTCQAKIARLAPNQGRKSRKTATENDIFWLDYAGLDKAVRPIYLEEKFSISFSELDETRAGYVGMRATLSRGGISREYVKWLTTTPAFEGMPKADAEASAASRAKRYLMLQIFNVAVGIDSDEKAPYEGIDNGIALDWIATIEAASDPKEVMAAYKNAIKVAENAADGQPDFKAWKTFTEARDKRLLELKRGGHE